MALCNRLLADLCMCQVFIHFSVLDFVYSLPFNFVLRFCKLFRGMWGGGAGEERGERLVVNQGTLG